MLSSVKLCFVLFGSVGLCCVFLKGEVLPFIGCIALSFVMLG